MVQMVLLADGAAFRSAITAIPPEATHDGLLRLDQSRTHLCQTPRSSG